MNIRLRTEIELTKAAFSIGHDDRVVLLGSCFSDNIGERLCRDGFNAVHNPLGPLYNPLSLARLIEDLMSHRIYNCSDFVEDSEGRAHCLDFASRYQSDCAEVLADVVNRDFSCLTDAFDKSSVIIVTFGSSFIYSTDGTTAGTVGNCHKFPASFFRRMSVEVETVVAVWRPLLEKLRAMGKNVLMTVSPIRHLADGLHGNELSKARLLLACDALSDLAAYFPAYEIMIDDLRDYRFYDRDLKHPSDLACDYIYEKFGDCFFSKKTVEKAELERRLSIKAFHRPIIKD